VPVQGCTLPFYVKGLLFLSDLNKTFEFVRQMLIKSTNIQFHWPEGGSVYEPKHVARNTTNTCNELRVVYDYMVGSDSFFIGHASP